MKKRLIKPLWSGVISIGFVLLSAFDTTTEITLQSSNKLSLPKEVLKKEAFIVLDTKCNVCHRKQNPLMVFKEKNMSKRAKKIYKMVFLERKMPKGNEIRLTSDEYTQLEKWLFTEEIF